jgi:hypothetical protein
MHARRMAVNSGDSYGQARRLLEQSESILQSVKSFADTYKRSLPETALAAVNRLLDQASPLVNLSTAASATRQDAAATAVLQLTLFDSEIAYLLTDLTAAIRSHCERAFEHLRRLIVVDAHQRDLWQGAYAAGEPACEALGATALLHHGIWTFKASSAGGRTDLVYSEPIDPEGVARAAEGLVLTEWKRTTQKHVTAQAAARLFESACAQARRYTEGPLAGFELTDYRCLVLVSWEDVEVPPDRMDGGTLYRHINIPVAPVAPSKRRPRKLGGT